VLAGLLSCRSRAHHSGGSSPKSNSFSSLLQQLSSKGSYTEKSAVGHLDEVLELGGGGYKMGGG